MVSTVRYCILIVDGYAIDTNRYCVFMSWTCSSVSGTPATKSQLAKDITTFLAWTAEPDHDLRQKFSIKVYDRYVVAKGKQFYHQLF